MRAWSFSEPLGLRAGRSLARTMHVVLHPPRVANARVDHFVSVRSSGFRSPLVATSGTHVCRSVWDLRVEPKLQIIPTNLTYFSNAMYQKTDFRASFSAISLKTLSKKVGDLPPQVM